jgi:small subunit ribosomal protein S10
MKDDCGGGFPPPQLFYLFIIFIFMPQVEIKKDDKVGVEPRVRIKIFSYDSKIIDEATKIIMETAERNNAKVVGPVPLPTEKKKFSVNRSTFVHNTSEEQYEMRIHKRIIDIIGMNPKAMDALMNIHLPSGVDIEVKML